jgi:prepilin-type N-terminal cleavage/methylation domain-containing protein
VEQLMRRPDATPDRAPRARPSQGPPPTAPRAGFTLLEIAIALAVFAIGMLSLAAMQLHALRSGSSGRHATQAAAIAQSRMEQLQRLRWTDLAPTVGFTAPITQSNTVQADPNQVEMSYAVDWRIANVEPGWTRSIDVRVRWDEENRPNRSVVLSSLRFNREGL